MVMPRAGDRMSSSATGEPADPPLNDESVKIRPPDMTPKARVRRRHLSAYCVREGFALWRVKVAGDPIGSGTSAREAWADAAAHKHPRPICRACSGRGYSHVTCLGWCPNYHACTSCHGTGFQPSLTNATKDPDTPSLRINHATA